ncbi:MAG: shikimate dehydrogenase [Candidatus Omnitrophica bacterium CG11_big_fil_rev_8_21_14_0_20_63_9]|nr:MAG: shikimate dehydrogenase [Candidatus Omnitrophica bacterium CG11_big_fil_rev_8_21_14_0_20_63_9]
MTRLFGVIGHPITHSLSPAMHAAALRALKLDALYSAFDVPPKFLRPMLKALWLSGVEGLNVTVPLKEAVIPLLDRVDPGARAIGAVNTIVRRGKRTIGYNTDGIGFRRALADLGWRARPGHAVILGAGGAARAVAWELAQVRGMRLTIANRHLERARRLARWLTRQRRGVEVSATTLRAVRLQDAALLVNATTVGMRASDRLPIDPAQLRRGLLVYDLIYHRRTPLVDAACRRGCVAAHGLSMLLYQGAESLRLWLRRAPPIGVMRRALEQAVR